MFDIKILTIDSLITRNMAIAWNVRCVILKEYCVVMAVSDYIMSHCLTRVLDV